MTKTEILDRCAVDADSRLTLGRVLDKAQMTESRNVPGHSQFLSDGEQALSRKALEHMGNPRHLFWGGYEGASRRVCVFLPDWQEKFLPEGEDDPLAAVEIPMPREANLTHRDFLGAMMGLGLTREVTGDILVGEDKCQVVCLKSVLGILLSQWSEVGRYPIKIREIPLSALEPMESAGKIKTETFQSLRFDAVAASGFGISRAKAASYISSGKVLLNHLPCTKPDRILEAGDSLSGKGLGKCVLKQVNGQSRKGRIIVELERF